MANLNRKQKTSIRHARSRKTLAGTPSRPRLAVHFSSKNIYVQVIDDQLGKTIASVNTTEGDFKAARRPAQTKIPPSKSAAWLPSAARPKTLPRSSSIGAACISRQSKALADAAREGGLEF